MSAADEVDPPAAGSERRRLRIDVGLAAALVVVVIGAAALVITLAQPVSMGFFACAPLSGDTFTTPGVHILSTGSLVAACVLAVGLVALAFWAGLRVGARRRRGDR